MLPPLVPVVVVLAWTALRSRGRAVGEVGTLLLVAAVAEWPLGMLGYMKFGGGPNNLAYCETFLVAFVAWAVAKLVGERVEGPRAAVLAAVLVLAAGACVWRLASVDSSVIGGPSKHELSYRLVRQSPGRYFFPRLPLAHLMGEGRLTHHHWGLYDYELAGEHVSDDWFWRYIPPDAVVVAHNDRPPGTRNLMYQRLAGKYPKQARRPELPGWYCFLRDGG